MLRSLIGISCLVLISCTSPSQSETSNPVKKTSGQTETKSQTKRATTPSKEKYPTLNNKTVVDFLTEYGKKNRETLVEMSTRFGNIKIRLYENTPLHRANFIYLTKRKYFDETQFYRVAKGFVCQAGNSDEWETQYTRKDIGMYTLPAELPMENIHKVGAVAAARSYENNPDKLSSPYEFYITLGPKYDEPTLKALANQESLNLTPLQKETYVNIGGQPTLDQQHTVFGEVVEGMDVVYEINKVEVDGREWPHEIIPIKIRIAE
jgi:peptidyl-prolyl cis-trans isomerase B (cyclophilin B)